ncbi:MAG: hypothetical protein Q4B36_05050 [Tissierellia bacterium]|nr:hypothetical protein [Tissierellia bacterium]
MKITNLLELNKALEEDLLLEVENSISIDETIHLKKGQKLIGTNDNVFLSFINGGSIELEGDNEISNLSIQTTPSKRAIRLKSNLEDLGEIKLKDLTITGMVQILTKAPNKYLDVKIENMDIVSSDSRNYPQRPMKYGVNVYQGALTIYNYNPDKESLINVDIDGIKLGRKNAPVIGSGVFIGGLNDDTGRIEVNNLVTDDIYSNGMIPTGQPNLITGAIFIVQSTNAKNILTRGNTVTYGTNDMVLDVWGKVEKWVVEKPIVSYGQSAIGFVNFGEVDYFKANSPIKTYGLGARGFNQYDGTIKEAIFDSIETVGEGSIGMQVSKPVGKIEIINSVKTKGSIGETLVKGVIMELAADAISIKEGGVVENLVIGENLEVGGKEVVAYHVDKGQVKKFSLNGKIIAEDDSSQEVKIENYGETDTTDIKEYL